MVLWSTDSRPNQLFDCAWYLTVRSVSDPDTDYIRLEERDRNGARGGLGDASQDM